MSNTFCIKKDPIERICQGDILGGYTITTIVSEIGGTDLVKKFNFPYIAIMSQDCDLCQYHKNKDNVSLNHQFLPNVLILPIFEADILKLGEHLINIFGIKQDQLNKDRFKFIKSNSDPRYHFINSALSELPTDLVIDFKIHFSVSFNSLYNNHKEKYKTSLNIPVREQLSQRFANYINRIGLPDYPNPTPNHVTP